MAQKRRKEQLMKRRERRLTALCIGGGIGAMLLSLFVCMMIFDIRPDETPVSAPVTTALPYDSTQPFSAGDLTSTQMNDLRANGRMHPPPDRPAARRPHIRQRWPARRQHRRFTRYAALPLPEHLHQFRNHGRPDRRTIQRGDDPLLCAILRESKRRDDRPAAAWAAHRRFRLDHRDPDGADLRLSGRNAGAIQPV